MLNCNSYKYIVFITFIFILYAINYKMDWFKESTG